MPGKKLPFSRQVAYAAGMMGWSILSNTIIVMLPYYYLPPSNAGLTPLVPQLLLLGVFNILSVIEASGGCAVRPFFSFAQRQEQESEGPADPVHETGCSACRLLLFSYVPSLGEGGNYFQWLVAGADHDPFLYCGNE